MGRYLYAYYTNNKDKLYNHDKKDVEVYEMEMDESKRQRLDLGHFNEYYGSCKRLIKNINILLFIAETAHDFEVLEILCFIVKECKECDCKYINISNS